METRYTLQHNLVFFLCHQWVLMITMLNHFFHFQFVTMTRYRHNFHVCEEQAWNAAESQQLLVNIGTDGESVSLRRYPLSNISPIYEDLHLLEYLDLITGPRDPTVEFDVKHQCKRIRNNLFKWGITILGVKFDAATLRVILRGMKIYKEMEIEAMVNPADKQNVPLAVKLVDALSKELDKENLSPGLLNMLPSFRILAVICNGILSLFARADMSIHDTLGHLSVMVHTLLFLFVTMI